MATSGHQRKPQTLSSPSATPAQRRVFWWNWELSLALCGAAAGVLAAVLAPRDAGNRMSVDGRAGVTILAPILVFLIGMWILLRQLRRYRPTTVAVRRPLLLIGFLAPVVILAVLFVGVPILLHVFPTTVTTVDWWLTDATAAQIGTAVVLPIVVAGFIGGTMGLVFGLFFWAMHHYDRWRSRSKDAPAASPVIICLVGGLFVGISAGVDLTQIADKN